MSATPEREQAEALRELIQSLVDCEPEMSSHDFTVKALPLLVQASDALAAAAGHVREAEAERDGARHLLQATGRVRAAAVERERELTRALRFIAQEAKDGQLEVRHGVANAPTFWLEAIEKRAREALAGGVSAAGRPPEQDEAKPSKCTCTPPFFEDDCRAVGRCIFQVPYSHAAAPEVLPETCVVCGTAIEPAPRYFTDDGKPRHMLCEPPGWDWAEVLPEETPR